MYSSSPSKAILFCFQVYLGYNQSIMISYNQGNNNSADFLWAVLSMEKTHSNVRDSAHGLFWILEKQYALNKDWAEKLLESLQDHYDILQIGEHTTFDYEDIYMDWKDFPCFNENLRKKKPHTSIRTRKNISANTKTFQVIHTTNQRKSVYHYSPTANDSPPLSNENITFFNGVYESITWTTPDFLPIPTIKVTFNRIILYSKKRVERINLDFNITVTDQRWKEKTTAEFPWLVIFESKSLDWPAKSLKKAIKKAGWTKINHMSKFLLWVHNIYDLDLNSKFEKYNKRIKKKTDTNS